MDSKMIRGCQELRLVEECSIFKSKNTLYDTIMFDTCHYRFIQTHRI